MEIIMTSEPTVAGHIALLINIPDVGMTGHQREESVTGQTEHNMACKGWTVAEAIKANPYFSAVPSAL